MSEQKKIALVEFRWHGHHPSFFQAFHEELDRISSVIPFHPRSDEAPLPADEEMDDEVLGHRWIRKWPAVANLYRFWRCGQRLRAYERKHQVKFDLVVFSSLYNGACLSPRLLDRLFPYRWVALLLDSDFCRRNVLAQLRRARSFDSLAAFRAEGCRGLLTLDQGILAALRNRLPGKAIDFLPEPVRTDPPNETFAPAQEIKRRAAGRAVVGCFGQFDKRKGGLEFLETARRSAGEPWLFVWIGALVENSFSPSELRLIESRRQELSANTLLLFETISAPSDFNALIAATDVLFLCYANHAGSSNMVHTAAVFQKRILVSDGFCMGDDTRRYALGLTVPRGDIDSYVAGLRTLFSETDGNKPEYERYRRDHAEERRRETLLRSVQSALAGGNAER